MDWRWSDLTFKLYIDTYYLRLELLRVSDTYPTGPPGRTGKPSSSETEHGGQEDTELNYSPSPSGPLASARSSGLNRNSPEFHLNRQTVNYMSMFRP